jgi:hypothetical protein
MFNPISDTYRYFDQKVKMLFEKPEPWETNPGRGEPDALLRTARAYIAYKQPVLKEGILSCYKKESDGHYQAYRCAPDIGAEDVSRDQTTGSLAALFINGDKTEFEEIGPKLRFRLSKRFLQGPGMWLWLRQWWVAYGIIEFFSIVFGIMWNKVLYRLLDRTKVYSEEEYLAKDPNTGVWFKENGTWKYIENAYWATNGNKLYSEYKKKLDENKFYKFLDMTEYMTYGAFLTVMMVYCMPQSIFRRLLVKLLKWNFKGENNLLLRAMFDKDVTKEEIDALKPMKGFRWTSRFDKSSYFDYLEGDDAKYNNLDKDILYGIMGYSAPEAVTLPAT